MSIASLPATAPDALGRGPSTTGNLPGTQASGMILLEYVNLFRKIGGAWEQFGSNVAATMEAFGASRRVALESWTHKPLMSLWIEGAGMLQEDDRVTRSDGVNWYVRGLPLTSANGAFTVALVERGTEDGLFDARDPAEPA